MSVKLRLRRMGRKKMPYYRIVAIDSRARVMVNISKKLAIIILFLIRLKLLLTVKKQSSGLIQALFPLIPLKVS